MDEAEPSWGDRLRAYVASNGVGGMTDAEVIAAVGRMTVHEAMEFIVTRHDAYRRKPRPLHLLYPMTPGRAHRLAYATELGRRVYGACSDDITPGAVADIGVRVATVKPGAFYVLCLDDLGIVRHEYVVHRGALVVHPAAAADAPSPAGVLLYADQHVSDASLVARDVASSYMAGDNVIGIKSLDQVVITYRGPTVMRLVLDPSQEVSRAP